MSFGRIVYAYNFKKTTEIYTLQLFVTYTKTSFLYEIDVVTGDVPYENFNV